VATAHTADGCILSLNPQSVLLPKFDTVTWPVPRVAGAFSAFLLASGVACDSHLSRRVWMAQT
jgi:hypothetical protein